MQGERKPWRREECGEFAKVNGVIDVRRAVDFGQRVSQQCFPSARAELTLFGSAVLIREKPGRPRKLLLVHQ